MKNRAIETDRMLYMTTTGCWVQEAGVMKTHKNEQFAVERRDDEVKEEQKLVGWKHEGEVTNS